MLIGTSAFENDDLRYSSSRVLHCCRSDPGEQLVSCFFTTFVSKDKTQPVCGFCRQVMKEGCISQAGKYNDILNSGSDFMDLVGAHQEALSTLDSIEAGTISKKIDIA